MDKKVIWIGYTPQYRTGGPIQANHRGVNAMRELQRSSRPGRIELGHVRHRKRIVRRPVAARTSLAQIKGK